MKISTVAQMRAMDRAAIEQFGIPEIVLMENAGQAAYTALRQQLGVVGRRFVIVCGSGNNGGDGFVVARKIIADGGRAKVFLLAAGNKFTGAARTHLTILEHLPVEIRPLTAVEDLHADLDRCDGIVDAILGTGLDREVRRLHARVIDRINAAGKPVLSVDIPSGINGDSGQIMGTAVRADATVSFGLPKIGNLTYPGYGHGGRLYVSHISFPPSLTDSQELTLAVNTPLELPPRDASGHKGTFGQVLFIAGAASYLGAPYLAAHAFLKAGGGYARLATPAVVAPFIAGKASELVLVPQEATRAGSIAGRNREALLALALKMDLVVMGPGLSLEAETQQLVRELVQRIQCPLLLDGDGITAVCGHRQLLRNRTAATLMTPHLGEMARLTGIPAADIPRQKICAARPNRRRPQCPYGPQGAPLAGRLSRRPRVRQS